MNKIFFTLLTVGTVLALGCITVPQSYNNLGIGFDVVNVTRTHENDNIKYSIIYIDPDCNCNKEIHSGENKAKDGRSVFINILERNSTITRLTIDSAQGNSKIISSTLILEITNNTNIIDVYK